MASAPPTPKLRSRLFALPGSLLRWARRLPRLIQIAFALLLISGFGVGGYYLFHKRGVNRTEAAVQAGWTRFDTAVRSGNEGDMQTALADVLAADPQNELALARRKALETAEGEATDPPILVLTLRMCIRRNRLAEANREADKLLAHLPHDWLAHCTKAAYFLSIDDRAAATKALDDLPEPSHGGARTDPSGLLLGIRLFRETGRDVAPLRAFVQAHVIPAMKSASAQGLPGREKVGLVECYLEGFDPNPAAPQPAGVQQGWAAAARHSDDAAAEAIETGDVNLLKRLGRLSPRLDAGLRNLLRNGQVTPEQFADLSQELEARTRTIWQAVQAKEPTNPEPFRGLAQSYLRAGGAENYIKGRELVAKGISVSTEDDPELGILFSRMLQLEGRPLEAYQALKATAEENPKKAIWWALAAEAAMAANERGFALDACGRLRQVDPNNRWAIRTEAKLWLDAGDASKAAQLLKPQGDAGLIRDPLTARTYVRALAESGLESLIDDFLKQAEQDALSSNNPLLAVAPLRGWADAPPTRARAIAIAARADRLLERFQDRLDLFLIRAEALARVAEWSEPAWDAVAVRNAINAYERVRAKDSPNRSVAFALARLRLTGENNPEQAGRELGAYFAVEPETTAAEIELIATIYRTTNKPADAIRVLEKVVQRRDATAGCWTQLALTYKALGKLPEARAALEHARSLPRTPREQTDYIVAARAIVQNSP